MSSLALAHIGDAVFGAARAPKLCVEGGTTNAAASADRRTRAGADAGALCPAHPALLTPEEAAVYRRGRNAHPHGIPKHATPGEYARATGLEALFGALYLRADRAHRGAVCRHDGGRPCHLTPCFSQPSPQSCAPTLVGARVDKVQQPARDTVVLQLRGRDGGGRLLLSANGNRPRVHLTQAQLENPAQPPMFCMLLRSIWRAAGLPVSASPRPRHARPDVRLHGRAGRALPQAPDPRAGRAQFQPDPHGAGRPHPRLPAARGL